MTNITRLARMFAYTTVAVSASVAILATSSLASAQTNASIHIVVSIDGTKGPGTQDSVDPTSPLAPLVQRYMDAAAVNSDRAQKIDLHYPGGMVAGIWGWNVWFDDSVEAGKTALRELVSSYEQKYNENVRWTFIGYSQGSIVAGDVASEIDQSTNMSLKQRLDVLLYSDPRQPNTGIETRLPGYRLTPGITFAGSRPLFRTVKVTWYYVPGDTIADSPPVQPSDVTALWVFYVLQGYFGYHTSYPHAPVIATVSQP